MPPEATGMTLRSVRPVHVEEQAARQIGLV
jgi:hypothetical protein